MAFNGLSHYNPCFLENSINVDFVKKSLLSVLLSLTEIAQIDFIGCVLK